MQPPVAEPAPDLGQFFQPFPQHRVILADYLLAHCHPATADPPARPPLAHPLALHKMRDRLPRRGGRYHLRGSSAPHLSVCSCRIAKEKERKDANQTPFEAFAYGIDIGKKRVLRSGAQSRECSAPVGTRS
jgi:hypothetical protein